ncbi:MAG: FecR/PupR family sigma factor regulator [Chloroflexia bacterium]|nr:FecR/PupR family sigma factor regulator [Chloroflexia bacterium]
MDTQERNIWEIIGIVLNGTPTIEEQEAFDKWLNSDPDNIKIYQILIRNGNNHSNSFTKSDKEAVF